MMARVTINLTRRQLEIVNCALALLGADEQAIECEGTTEAMVLRTQDVILTALYPDK